MSESEAGSGQSEYSSGTSASGETWSDERMPTAGSDDSTSGTSGSMGSEEAGPTLSDPQVAAITELVNNSEVEQAQLAQSKSKNPRVLNFAQMMIRYHGDAKQKQSALGLSSASSSLSRSLSEEGRSTMATLRDKSGSEFDRAYIQAQIEQHQKTLDTIDRQLLPSVKNQALRQQIQTMRPTIQQHLESAREVQQSLSEAEERSSGSTSGGNSDRKSKTSGGASGR